MKVVHAAISVGLLLGLNVCVFAQDFGGLPGTLDWQIIRGDSVRVITTPATEAFASRALALDEALIDLRPISLGSRIEPIDVVVQPSTVIANGFVGLEPYRSFLYATPPQQQTVVSSNAWIDALAVHEYRHVEQYNNLNRGWTRAFDFVFGDGGRSVLQSLSTPTWFFEGDAVYYETALTYAGRGRTPSFTALQRALAQAEVRYPYLKARNGSLRDRVPDRYPLGFALVAHGRHAYVDPWPQVIRDAGNFWPPVFPFSLSLKQATRHHTPSFYRATFDSLNSVWRAQMAARTLTPHASLTLTGKQLTRYQTPLPIDDAGSYVAVRRSQTRIAELVRRDSAGNEEVLTPLGVNVDGSLSYAAGQLVWTQLRQLPRRPNETYSVVMRHDMISGRTVQLTQRSKYFSPGLSADATRIVAVEQLVSGSSALVVLDAQSGAELHRYPVAFDLVAFPRYTADPEQVVALVKQNGWLQYVKFDIDEAAGGLRTTALTSPTRHTLGPPYPHGEYVYFDASYSGIDNIYRVPLAGGKIEQLTEVAVSASMPATDGERLYFVEVEADGDPIALLMQPDWLGKPLDEVTELAFLSKYDHLLVGGAAEAFRNSFYDASPSTGDLLLQRTNQNVDTSVTAEAYGGFLRGFSFYTLQPLVNLTESSLTLIGGNILADVRAEVTAGYNLNEQRGFGEASVTVARTWPWISAEVGIAKRAFNRFGTVGDSSAFIELVEFEQRRVGLLLEAPVQQLNGAYTMSLRPNLGLRYYDFNAPLADQRVPLDGSMVAASLGLRFQYLRQLAPKHITPRGGFTFDVDYHRALGAASASQMTSNVGLFLPGVVRSHSILLQARARVEAADNAYQFADFVRYARGVDKPFSDWATGLSLDYFFPLLYPDRGITGLIYVKRLRATLWGDITQLRLPDFFSDRSERLSSVGIDLLMDATFLNLIDVPVGVRVPYVLEGSRFSGGDASGVQGVQVLVALPF